MHEVLVNRLGGLSLPRKSVVRLTDRPDMTLDVYRGRKTTIQPTNTPGGPGGAIFFDPDEATVYIHVGSAGFDILFLCNILVWNAKEWMRLHTICSHNVSRERMPSRLNEILSIPFPSTQQNIYSAGNGQWYGGQMHLVFVWGPRNL